MFIALLEKSKDGNNPSPSMDKRINKMDQQNEPIDTTFLGRHYYATLLSHTKEEILMRYSMDQLC